MFILLWIVTGLYNTPSEARQYFSVGDKMIARSFSATVVEEDGTIAAVLADTNGVAQVRVTYGKSGHDTYALAPMTVTNGQPVKVIGVTARHSEAPGVLPSFTRVVLPK